MFNLLDFKVKKARYMIIYLMVAMYFVVYLQRTNISILLVDPVFLEYMGLVGKSGMQGFIMTAFLLPYAFTNMFVSPLGDKIGPRKTMLLGTLIAVFGTLAGGIAPTFVLLLVSRLILGVGHGIYYPTLSIFVRNWFVPQERGLANALIAVGGVSAPLVAMPLFTWLIGSYSWKSTFFIVAILGVIAALPLMLRIITDGPDDNTHITDEEKNLIAAQAVQQREADNSDQGAMLNVLKTLDFWLITASYLAYLSIWWGLFTWLPQYLMMARGFSLQSLGWISSLPYACAAVAVLISGSLSDRLGKRALLGVIFLSATTLCLLATPSVSSPYICVALMTLSVGLDVAFYPVAWAILQSKLPANLIGAGSGMMNGICNLCSAFTPFLMGLLIESTGLYDAGIYLLAGFGFMGVVCSGVLLKRGN
ncbi:MAG TPA: MFS transporter [Syntrophomonas sp.]|nr:MFS transporter [Syntrophomonas sp.]